MRTFVLISVLSIAITLFGCERKPEPTKPTKSPAGGSTGTAASGDQTSSDKDDHDHKPGDKDDHDHAKTGEKHVDHHGGPVIELGTTTVNGMNLKASRDAGDLKAGGEAPIDLWIDSGLGNAAAVRFWIGTEDAKGSVKAKAEVEEGKWHTHAELPDPMPAGSKLWVEIEGKDGKKSVASFDLKS